MRTQFHTTDRTNQFVVAIQKLSEAENAVLTAMSETYGEDRGFKMTQELGFDKMNDEVLRCLRVVMLENLRDNPTTI